MFTEQQDKWLKRIEELFFRYGIKVLTMDDIARELGISKKTLYQFVDNKDDLVSKVMDRHIAIQCRVDEDLHTKASDAIDELMLVIRETMIEFQQMKPNIIFELQKYHREVWERITQFQREYIYNLALKNIEWGRKDGLYREDFDAHVVTKLYISQSLSIFDDDWFPKPPHSFDVLFRECILYFLHSVASDKGRALIKQKL